jgi:hypothetical protein
MTAGSTDNRVGAVWTAVDVVLILAMGLVAEAAHFSWQDGRTILNGDSAQYVDAAEGLLDPGKDPNFAVRKPGYPLILAGVAVAAGNMSWAGIAANHLFQALLPLAAYGLGRTIARRHARRSRLVGWAAAILTIAQLQAHLAGGRIMSEAAYMCFMSFGILVLAAALTNRRSMWLMVLAGSLLATSWLIRSVALVVIMAALLCTVWVLRDRWRRAVTGCLCVALPLLAAVLFECSLNQAYGGRFRTSTGTLGPILMMRTRHLQGLPMPNSEAGKRCGELLPDRDPQDAYRAAEVDAWVARYRAVHDHGMHDWQVDALMRQTAWEMISERPSEFLQCGLEVFIGHLLRQTSGPSCARVPAEHRRPVVVHPVGVNDPEFQGNWYAYWGLPHRTVEESLALAGRIQAAADRRAPFAESEPLSTLRYLSMLPAVTDVLGVLRGVGSLWPGFALILCAVLGLNRRTCAFLAVAYVLDAALISICCPSEAATGRYQSVWLVTDTVLATALVVVPLQVAWSRFKAPVEPVSMSNRLRTTVHD